MHVLVVEDTPEEANRMIPVIEQESLIPVVVPSLGEARALLLDDKHDIQMVLLDRTLGEGGEGLDLMDWLREKGFEDLPVIVISALGNLDDRVAGLSSGALAYITKPFNAGELRVQMRALLSRSLLRVGRLTLDLRKREIAIDDRIVPTSPKRFLILALLAANEGRPVGKHALIRKAWPNSRTATVRYLETEISMLRKDLRHVFGEAPIIESQNGGYRLVVETLQ